MTAVQGYAEGIVAIAAAEGVQERVENELFEIGQAIEANEDLRSTLGDAALPVATRLQIVEDLLGGRAVPATIGAVSMLVTVGRATELPEVARAVLDRGAASRNRVVAEVRTATALSEEQRERLAAALGEATGKEVEVKVVIDPSVLGGVVAQIGDTVIDGSLRHRLSQIRASLV